MCFSLFIQHFTLFIASSLHSYIHKHKHYVHSIMNCQSNTNNYPVQYQCKCGKAFKSQMGLQSHVTKMHGSLKQELVLKQSLKSEYISNYKQAKQNVKIKSIRYKLEDVQNTAIVCICGLTFESKTILQSHIKQKHKETKELQFNDSESEEYYSQEQTPKKRGKLPSGSQILKLFADKSFVCGCDRCYENGELLMNHIKTAHDGLPPLGSIFGIRKEVGYRIKSLYYQDNKDAKKEIQKRYLLNRRSYALKKGKYSCGCGEVFSTQQPLKQHICNEHQGLVMANSYGLALNKKTCKRILAVCGVCFVACIKYWKCKDCCKGTWCGECADGNDQIQLHVKQGHQLEQIK